MLVALGVVTHGRENCNNDDRTNMFKARHVTAVWRPMKRNDDIVCAVESLRKPLLPACRSSPKPCVISFDRKSLATGETRKNVPDCVSTWKTVQSTILNYDSPWRLTSFDVTVRDQFRSSVVPIRNNIGRHSSHTPHARSNI